MKKSLITVLSVLALLSTSCNQSKSTDDAKANGIVNANLANALDSASYAIGIDAGMKMKTSFQYNPFPGDTVNYDAIAAGFAAALKNDNPPMSPEEMSKAIDNYITWYIQEQLKVTRPEEEKFLESNKSKEGVVVTPSGLHFRSIVEGKGQAPSDTSWVRVNYVGRLIDGTVFDQTSDHPQPTVFNLRGVVPGFSEGIKMMKEGGKAELVIPSRLAYGDNIGPSKDIKPGSCIIFEVELLEANAKRPDRHGMPRH